MISKQTDKVTLALIETYGKQNPLTKANLKNYLEWRTERKWSDRQIFALIEGFRKAGFPVLSTKSKPAGYFWARSVDDLKDFEREFASQARTMFRTARAMRKNYQRLAGQFDLTFEPVETV